MILCVSAWESVDVIRKVVLSQWWGYIRKNVALFMCIRDVLNNEIRNSYQIKKPVYFRQAFAFLIKLFQRGQILNM